MLQAEFDRELEWAGARRKCDGAGAGAWGVLGLGAWGVLGLGVQLLVGGYLVLMVLGLFIAARATPKRPGQTTDEYVDEVYEKWAGGPPLGPLN